MSSEKSLRSPYESGKTLEKYEIKQKSLTNIYLSFCFLLIIASFILMRPYIKSVVNEVKFTYVAEEYKSENLKVKDQKK